MRPDPITPHPSRLSPEHPQYAVIMQVHARACAAGDPGYIDPTSGLFTMTAAYHIERGRCCDNGCRHCPYVGTDSA